jgi:hypothetical protein
MLQTKIPVAHREGRTRSLQIAPHAQPHCKSLTLYPIELGGHDYTFVIGIHDLYIGINHAQILVAESEKKHACDTANTMIHQMNTVRLSTFRAHTEASLTFKGVGRNVLLVIFNIQSTPMPEIPILVNKWNTYGLWGRIFRPPTWWTEKGMGSKIKVYVFALLFCFLPLLDLWQADSEISDRFLEQQYRIF